jgi:hypothetical protein
MPASPQDILTFALLAVSLMVIGLAAVDSDFDRRALKRRRVNGVRGLVARQSLRRNVLKFIATAMIVGVIVWSERQSGASLADLEHNLNVRNGWVSAAVVLFAVSATLDLIDARRIRRKVRDGQWDPPPGR